MAAPAIRRWWAARRTAEAVDARRRRRTYRAGVRRQRRAVRWERCHAAAAAVRRPVLLVAGLACLTAAVWLLRGSPSGLAAAGVSLLLLEWLTGPERPRTPRAPRPPRRR